jgi:hypothetical protein
MNARQQRVEEKNRMVRRLNRLITSLIWLQGAANLDAAEAATLRDAIDDARLTLRDLRKDGTV